MTAKQRLAELDALTSQLVSGVRALGHRLRELERHAYAGGGRR